jgi:hypothetical protein
MDSSLAPFSEMPHREKLVQLRLTAEEWKILCSEGQKKKISNSQLIRNALKFYLAGDEI